MTMPATRKRQKQKRMWAAEGDNSPMAVVETRGEALEDVHSMAECGDHTGRIFPVTVTWAVPNPPRKRKAKS